MAKSTNDVFTNKYRLYGDMLFRLSMVYLNNKMDCEDVMQESFIKLLYNAPRFIDLDHEKKWLVRVTINLCKDKLKESWRKKRSDIDVSEFNVYLRKDINLTEAILRLPEKIRIPIHLYYYVGYKINEIAKILRISESAVKMRLKRGRDTMKKEMEKEKNYGR